MTRTDQRSVLSSGSHAHEIRRAFEEHRLLRVAGAHDGLSAALAAEAGFDAIWASGLEISAAYGLPDISLLGMSEFLSSATTIRRAVDLPVIADCDTGFGGELNAALMMMRYSEASIAGVCIEDKVFPKRNSFVAAGQQLLDAETFAHKISAAAEAKNGSETVLLARTEALICGLDVDEAVRRCHSYVDAGADGVLVHSKAVDSTEVVSFMSRWKQRAPVAVVPTTYSQFSVTEAREAGIAMVIYANQGMRAMIRAVRDAWSTVLTEGSTEGIEASIASVKELFEISGMNEWLSKER